MIEQYGILSLVLLYLGVNVYYRNMKSIILFLVSFVVMYPVFPNKLYPLLIAYTISIAFNIVKNFHLLENFSSKKIVKESTKEDEVPIIKYDLLVEIASEGDETLTRFLDEHCFNNGDIKDVEVMKGLATYKNQFLLKSQEKL